MKEELAVFIHEIDRLHEEYHRCENKETKQLIQGDMCLLVEASRQLNKQKSR
jgi:hypothetical protein